MDNRHDEVDDDDDNDEIREMKTTKMMEMKMIGVRNTEDEGEK